ncbi:unnamed protein product, partial [Ceratitis capitata]
MVLKRSVKQLQQLKANRSEATSSAQIDKDEKGRDGNNSRSSERCKGMCEERVQLQWQLAVGCWIGINELSEYTSNRGAGIGRGVGVRA